MASTGIMENIDLEEGKIRIKGKWLTEDEIRYSIKMKVSSDDYNVADLAVALKTLITEMNKSKVLKVRVPKELADELEEISKSRGETVESTLRNLLMEYVNKGGTFSQSQEDEDESYEEVEVEPASKDVRGVTIDRDMESQDEPEDEEEFGISIEDDELEEDSEGGLLELETPRRNSGFASADDLDVEDITEFDIPGDEIEEVEVEEVARTPKPKTSLRRKKMKRKRRG